MLYFLDTNVLLDIFDRRRTTSSDTLQFLKENNDHQYACSEDMVSTFFYITRKDYSNTEITFFWEAFQENSTIFPFGKTVLQKSFEFCQNNPQADLEDVLQAFTAKENNCDAFVTNDQTFVSGIIPLIFPSL